MCSSSKGQVRVRRAVFPEAMQKLGLLAFRSKVLGEMTSLCPCKSGLCFSLAVPRRLLGIGNVTIDSISTPKFAVTQIDSAVLVSQMAALIQQTGAALACSQPEQGLSKK